METKQGYVKRNIVYIGMSCRLIIFFLPLCPFVLGLFDEETADWFGPAERFTLYILLTPITCWLVIFFLNFIVQNCYNYIRAGISIGIFRTVFGYTTLVFLHFTEFFLITWKGTHPTAIDHFFIYIACIEVCFAFYIGFYLNGLFANKTQAE